MLLVPFGRESRQLSQLSRFFDDTFDRVLSANWPADAPSLRSPALDVAETDAGYTVTLEVPGVTKEDIKINIEGRQVNVQASTQRNDEKKEKDEGGRVVYRERALSSYARSFTLPLEVDQAGAAAKLDNGVLTLTLPKRTARGTAQITVN